MMNYLNFRKWSICSQLWCLTARAKLKRTSQDNADLLYHAFILYFYITSNLYRIVSFKLKSQSSKLDEEIPADQIPNNLKLFQ
jgi:hypothetical protein